jgi:hypothetical protein
VTNGRRALVALLATCALASPSCGGGMLFAQDRRVEFVSPARNGKVTLPLVVSWKLLEGAEVGRDIASFALFFDLEPQAPNEPLSTLARGDIDCERTPGCPDAAYFERRGVYVTKDTRLVVDDLLPLAGVDIEKGERDVHDVTIVVLDEQGRRTSEAFWSRTFEVVHPQTADD